MLMVRALINDVSVMDMGIAGRALMSRIVQDHETRVCGEIDTHCFVSS